MNKREELINKIRYDFDKLVINDSYEDLSVTINNKIINIVYNYFRGVYIISSVDYCYFKYETNELNNVLDFLEYLCNY